MHKSIKWSSFADKDLAKLLEYLDSKWDNSVCIKFIINLDSSIFFIQQNPKQFPIFSSELQIR